MNQTLALINAGTVQRTVRAECRCSKTPLCSRPRGLPKGEASGGGLEGKSRDLAALGRHSRKRAILEKLPERKRPLRI